MEVDRNAWADIMFQVHQRFMGVDKSYTANVEQSLFFDTKTKEYELRIRKNNLPLMFGKKSALYFDDKNPSEILEKLTNGIRTGELDGAIRSHRLKVNRGKKRTQNKQILSDLK